MKHNQHISYYCFNTDCKNSIFYIDAVNLCLPLSLKTISTDKFCKECNQKLISLMDIEIKKALLPLTCPEDWDWSPQ
jgi:hypothetical protein